MTPKKYKRSLHTRIWLSFLVFGASLATLVVSAAHFALEEIEHQIANRELADELAHYFKLHGNDSQAALPSGANLQSYRARDGDERQLPAFLSGLLPGAHEISADGNTYHVLVGMLGSDKIYIVRNATLFEEREEMVASALWATVLGAALVALAVGYLLSRQVMAPVASLAQHVVSLSPDTRASHLAAHFARDEVGELADAFDRYVDRLTAFIEREQQFTADASHELRTPLTVIKGAAELLLTDISLPARSQRVVHRIDRASREMSQIVEALLFLARDSGSHSDALGERANVAEVVHGLVDAHRYLWTGKPLRVEVQVQENFFLPVAPVVLGIVVGNLLRNAITYTLQGEVTLRVAKPEIVVRDTGPGIPPEDLPHVFERHYRGRSAQDGGSGLGLAIVRRVCARHGWEITLANLPGHGTEAVLTIPGVDPSLPLIPPWNRTAS